MKRKSAQWRDARRKLEKIGEADSITLTGADGTTTDVTEAFRINDVAAIGAAIRPSLQTILKGEPTVAKELKIATLARIKDCKITPECAEMKFEGFNFTPDQYREIAEIIKEKIAVMVTITETNKKLDFETGEVKTA
jgi:hypothetical protein